MVNTVSESMRGAEEAYSGWESPGNPKDVVDRAPSHTSLGVCTDGILGRRDVPCPHALRLVSLVMFLCTERPVKKRWGQVVAGRCLRFTLRNRACMVSLDHIWRWICCGSRRSGLPCSVAAELWSVLALLPLSFTNLRPVVDGQAACSDASKNGGAVCVSRQLSSIGLRHIAAQTRPMPHVAAKTFGLLSLFDGVGEARQAWSLLGLEVAAYFSVELD